MASQSKIVLVTDETTLTIRRADQHGGQVLQLIFVEQQLVLVPCVLMEPKSPMSIRTDAPSK